MKTLERAITELPAIRAPHGLRERILARINEAAERSLRLHRALFGMLSLGSVALMVPAVGFAVREFSQSAFASYFSLIFSDGGIVLAHWREVAFSLAESAPVAGLTFTLAAAWALLASVRAFARYTDRTRFSHAVSYN